MSQPCLSGRLRLLLLLLLILGLSGSMGVAADPASTKSAASLDVAKHASLGHVALAERGSKITPSEHDVLELDGKVSGGITSQRRQWGVKVGQIPIPTFHISSRFKAMFVS